MKPDENQGLTGIREVVSYGFARYSEHPSLNMMVDGRERAQQIAPESGW